MGVRIGKIELTGVQDLHTEESRTLVEQRVPEQQGSQFQDLGREPVTILIDGLLLGDDALSALETLRQAHARAEPQSFAADLVVGSELTEVIIEEFRVRQVAGYRDRYRFSLRLREHVEPPQSASAALAPVNAGVAADGAAWSDASLAAAGVLQDPASLSSALAANPALLDNLDMDALGSAVASNLDGLGAGQLDGLIGTLANADPGKAGSLFESLRNAGALGGMLAKYAQEGMDFLRQLDPSTLSDLMQAFSGGLDFLKQLQAVAGSAGRLADDIGHLELPAGFERIVKGGLK